MRRQAPSRGRNGQRFGSRRIASTVLCASLMAGIAWGKPTWAIACQAASSDIQPAGQMLHNVTAGDAIHTAGRHSARFNRDRNARRQSGRSFARCARGEPAPVPTEPDRPALCSTVVDLRAATPLSCADSRTISSPLPSPSSIGRVGIPMGTTELGGAGVSPAAPVTGPGLFSG